MSPLIEKIKMVQKDVADIYKDGVIGCFIKNVHYIVLL